MLKNLLCYFMTMAGHDQAHVVEKGANVVVESMVEKERKTSAEPAEKWTTSRIKFDPEFTKKYSAMLEEHSPLPQNVCELIVGYAPLQWQRESLKSVQSLGCLHEHGLVASFKHNNGTYLLGWKWNEVYCVNTDNDTVTEKHFDSGSISCMAYLAAKQRIALTRSFRLTSNPTIELWDIDPDNLSSAHHVKTVEIPVLRGPSIKYLEPSPDGTKIAAASGCMYDAVWILNDNGDLLCSLFKEEPMEPGLSYIDYRPGDRNLDFPIKRRTMHSLYWKHACEETGPIAWSDEDLLLVGHGDKGLLAMDARTGELVQQMDEYAGCTPELIKVLPKTYRCHSKPHPHQVLKDHVLVYNGWLKANPFYADKDGRSKEIIVRTGVDFDRNLCGKITELCISPGGGLVAGIGEPTGKFVANLCVWNSKTGKEIARFSHRLDYSPSNSKLCFLPEEKLACLIGKSLYVFSIGY